MNTHQVYFALIVYAILIFTAYFMSKLLKINHQSNRFESLDGFRGILAISVFIHHAAIWKGFLETNEWNSPKEVFYHHLGGTSVSFFFMITSFLFINKLIKDSEKADFDAKAFFISRFFRIVPLYYLSVLMILIFTLVATNFEIVSTYKDFIITGFHWATFNIFNKIPFNQFFDANLVNASVEWSLSYEWFFYFTIPLFSIFFVKSNQKKLAYAIISISFILLFVIFHKVLLLPMLSFVGGALSPFILKYYPKISTKVAPSKIISLSIIVLMFYLLNSERKLVNFIIITYIFTVISLGNNVFGILKSNILKFLGEISYSTYLLHGIILFVGLYLILGIENLKKYTDSEYCLAIFAISPFVIIVSTITYKFIEAPFINYGKQMIRNSKK